MKREGNIFTGGRTSVGVALRREYAPQGQSSRDKAAPKPLIQVPARLPVRAALWNGFGLTVFERAERAGG